MSVQASDIWRKCSTCKKPLRFGERYWACNVTTCNARATAFAFCSVECWDAHIPVMNHRSAWSEERRAPSAAEARAVSAAPAGNAPARGSAPRSAPKGMPTKGVHVSESSESGEEVLVVASKVKAYIKDKSGMNTSRDTLLALSELIRNAVDGAIDKARADGRKTVMARDF